MKAEMEKRQPAPISFFMAADQNSSFPRYS